MDDAAPLHRFRNNSTAIGTGNPAWEAARAAGLIDIRADYDTGGRLRRLDGHRFINCCSCSYLGLANHPDILAGAVEALQTQGAMDLPTTRIRLRLNLLEDFEDQLTELVGCRTLSAVTCSSATAGILPLMGSGHLSYDGKPRVMVFDRFAHFSISLVKPICADETEVLTAPHNDLNFLEDVCRKRDRVAYVCEGVYSTGGAAPIKELLELQDRYGLQLFIDDSHSLSLWGPKGAGYARSLMGEVSPDTIIVASLGKGFGTSGGIVMLGPDRLEPIMTRFAGPLAWSQGLNVPSIGAGMASVRLHNSPELGRLQHALQRNIALFDELVLTEQRADGFPLKVIHVGEADAAVQASAEMLERGFYTSAVFFPIVRRGHAALRIMIRADNTPEDIRAFAAAVHEVVGDSCRVPAAAATPAEPADPAALAAAGQPPSA
jgi:7-keto-8-aminopelargonate synthetase-like enzyme